MCLILFAWQNHPRYALVVAANRDEFHARPTAAAGFWSEHPDLLAGRDLEAGGTWLGFTRQGRFAAVTNCREPKPGEPALERSRGHLARDYLLGRAGPDEYAKQLRECGGTYRGFNALLGDRNQMVYVSNRSEDALALRAGSYGLSNHLLDSDWPKIRQGRARLDAQLREEQLDADSLLEILVNQKPAPGPEPAGFELGLASDLITRSTFVLSPTYRTRSSTVLLVDHDGVVKFVERQFDSAGSASNTTRYYFRLAS